MLKNTLFGLFLLASISSCELGGGGEPPGLKTPTELYTLNDSLVGTPQEFDMGNNIISFDPILTKISLTNNFIFVGDLQSAGSVWKMNYNGEILDQLNPANAFYIYDNFIYVISNNPSQINKYDQNFSIVSTKSSSSNSFEARLFAVGTDTACFYSDANSIEHVKFFNNTSTTIGSAGSGDLQFDSYLVELIVDSDLIYGLDIGNKRINILNPDGSFDSEIPIDLSTMQSISSTANMLAINSDYFFIGNSSNVGDQIQLIRRSDMKYVGFIELGKISKDAMVATEDKLYVISSYPSNKLIIINIL